MFSIIHDNGSVRYEHVKRSPVSFDFHLHEECEIYFLISGDVDYFVDKKIYPLHVGDMIITNPHEVHKPLLKDVRIYERVVLRFRASATGVMGGQRFDMLHCFLNRPAGENNRIPLTTLQSNEMATRFRLFDGLSAYPREAADVLLTSYTAALLVDINLIAGDRPYPEDRSHMHPNLGPVLDYIDQNLAGDLTLQSLEQSFFMSGCHLSRLFKRYVGINLHAYIRCKRIALAKNLLTQGFSVTEACTRCGFNDYSNFIKTFREIAGTSPGKYRMEWMKRI